MSEYNKGIFTAGHPDVHENDCYCDFEAGSKCSECNEAAVRELVRMKERAKITAWLRDLSTPLKRGEATYCPIMLAEDIEDAMHLLTDDPRN